LAQNKEVGIVESYFRELSFLKPRKALNKAYLRIKPNRTKIELFKDNLMQLPDKIGKELFGNRFSFIATIFLLLFAQVRSCSSMEEDIMNTL